MDLTSKKLINFIIKLLMIALIVTASYFILKYAFKWLLPFIIAYIIASIIEPIISLMEKKLKLPRKIASVITIIFSLLIFTTFITLLIYRIIYEIKELAERLPAFIDLYSEQLIRLFDKGVALYINLPAEISIFVDTLVKQLSQNFMELLPSATEATKLAYNVAKSLPSTLIFFIILFMSIYFISSDKEKITRFFKNQLPSTWVTNIVTIKNNLLFALVGYIKAQLILMSITFIELSIGFLIMRVNYAILLALIISIIDAFPILGTGTILIPWAIISLITGNYTRAFPLIMLYGIVLLVRQLLEPRVLGGQIGLYPLVTLVSMYVGLQALGFIGMILGPVTVLILINLHKTGVFKSWRE